MSMYNSLIILKISFNYNFILILIKCKKKGNLNFMLNNILYQLWNRALMHKTVRLRCFLLISFSCVSYYRKIINILLLLFQSIISYTLYLINLSLKKLENHLSPYKSMKESKKVWKHMRGLSIKGLYNVFVFITISRKYLGDLSQL